MSPDVIVTVVDEDIISIDMVGPGAQLALEAAARAEAAAERAVTGLRLPEETPAPLSAPASATATPGIPTNGTDAAPAINAALADPSIQAVILPASMNIGLASAVVIPSGKAVFGRGRHATRLFALPGFAGGAGNEFNGLVCSAVLGRDVTVADLTVDAMKIGAGPTRLNGVKMLGAGRFHDARVTAVNCSGYAHFAQINGATLASGVVTEGVALNSQIHFEPSGGDGVEYNDCESGDGDGDIDCGSWLHPLQGSRNITFRRFRGRGRAGNAIECTHNEGKEQASIFFIEPDIEVTGGGMVASGNARTRDALFVGGHVRATALVLNLSGLTGRVLGTEFQGGGEAVKLEAGTVLDFDRESLIRAVAPPGLSAFGLQLAGGARARFAGTIEGESTVAVYPVGGPSLRNLELLDEARLTRTATLDVTSGLEEFTPVHVSAPLRFTGAGAQTYRVLNDNDRDVALGSTINLELLGPGPLVVAAGAGVTLNAPEGTRLTTPLAKARLTKTASNTWLLTGDVSDIALGASMPVQAYGAGATVSAIDADGMYAFLADSSGANRAIGTAASLAGDLIIELQVTASTNLFIGLDNEEAFGARDYTELTEALQLDGGVSSGFVFAWKGGAGQQQLAGRGGQRVYFERLGGAWNVYYGTSWAAAKETAPVFVSTASAGARFLAITNIANGAAGRVRFVAHPGG